MLDKPRHSEQLVVCRVSGSKSKLLVRDDAVGDVIIQLLLYYFFEYLAKEAQQTNWSVVGWIGEIFSRFRNRDYFSYFPSIWEI